MDYSEMHWGFKNFIKKKEVRKKISNEQKENGRGKKKREGKKKVNKNITKKGEKKN